AQRVPLPDPRLQATQLLDSYDELRKEILAQVGLSPICVAQLFNDWEYKTRLPARAQAAELTRLAHHWLLAGDPTAAQVGERVVVAHLLWVLPHPLRQAAGMLNPHTVGDLVEAIELAEAAQHREAAFSPEGEPGSTHAGGRLATSKQAGGSRPTGQVYAQGTTPLAESGLTDCPTCQRMSPRHLPPAR
uniref:SCAN box domain-containing protein n=1 Tax=Cyprinus carpio carpio TaxID=630221 RepID=A0A9J8CUZ4_CYPCA